MTRPGARAWGARALRPSPGPLLWETQHAASVGGASWKVWGAGGPGRRAAPPPAPPPAGAAEAVHEPPDVGSAQQQGWARKGTARCTQARVSGAGARACRFPLRSAHSPLPTSGVKWVQPWPPGPLTLRAPFPAGLPLLICVVSVSSAVDSYGTANK